MKKVLSILLAVALLVSMLPSTTLAAYSDVQGHWGQTAIEKWSALGIIKGSDNAFRPNDPITRGEIAVILDRIMRYKTKAQNNFLDLDEAFYTEAILKATATGVMKGDGNTVRPTDNITREEASVMLGRALGLNQTTTIEKKFSDSANISLWAVGYVNTMIINGYLQGSNGKFNPKSPITRAEFVTILDNAVKNLFNESKEYTQNVSGTAIICTAGVSLKNSIIQGDLIISEGVGDGNITLDGVTVLGRIIVRGGGANSIYVKGNSSIASIVMSKTDDGAIRVVADSDADIEMIYIDDGKDDIILTGTFSNVSITANATVRAVGAEIKKIELSAEGSSLDVDKDTTIEEVAVTEAAKSTEITVSGTVTKLETSAPETALNVSGTVSTLNAGATAEGSNINISSGANVSTLNTQTKITVDNQGVIANAEINADGVTLGGNKPSHVEVADTVTEKPTDSSGNTVPESNPADDEPTPGISLTNVRAVNAATITFNSLVADATIMWNNITLGETTIAGNNTITVPLMVSGVSNTLAANKAGYLSFVKNDVIYTTPYNTTASLGAWVLDRTAPKSWTEADGRITLETQTAPSNNWYAWHGKKAETEIGLTSDWMVQTQLELTDEMITRDGIRTSIWLQVEGSQNFHIGQQGVIDWAILQFKRDSSADTAGWQTWSSETGTWVTLNSIPTETGIYTLTMIYESGTLSQYINGILVNSYIINAAEGISAPTNIFLQSYSFGESYSTTWKVPTAEYFAMYSADAMIVSSVSALKEAITNALAGDTIYVANGEYDFTEQLNITKSLTFEGLGEVTFKATNSSWSTVNGQKHLLTIYSAELQPVTISNMTIDANGYSFALNAYNNANGILNDITIKNSRGAALTVNGSTIVANNLNTSGNAWGAVNVDPGSSVLTPSIFTLRGNGVLSENNQIWSDGAHINDTATVTVDAEGYTQYDIDGNENGFLWSNRPA